MEARAARVGAVLCPLSALHVGYVALGSALFVSIVFFVTEHGHGPRCARVITMIQDDVPKSNLEISILHDLISLFGSSVSCVLEVVNILVEAKKLYDFFWIF